MRSAWTRLLAATAGMLAIVGVALAADTMGGTTGTGGSPEGQPAPPDSPTMGGREPGAGTGEGRAPRTRRDEPTGEPMVPPGQPPGEHHRNHE